MTYEMKHEKILNERDKTLVDVSKNLGFPTT